MKNRENKYRELSLDAIRCRPCQSMSINGTRLYGNYFIRGEKSSANSAEGLGTRELIDLVPELLRS